MEYLKNHKGETKMEFVLSCKGNAYPCEVMIDDDNGRYLVKKADSSGEFFNTPSELASWVLENWKPEQFNDQQQFSKMIDEIKPFLQENGAK